MKPHSVQESMIESLQDEADRLRLRIHNDAVRMSRLKRAVRILLAVVVALAVAFVATNARAQSSSEWQAHQLALAAAAVALHGADWAQTRRIHESDGRFREAAPITKAVIGESPDAARVDAFMLVTGAAVFAVAHFMPEYRTAILTAWAASRLVVVVNNHSIGLRIGGSF